MMLNRYLASWVVVPAVLAAGSCLAAEGARLLPKPPRPSGQQTRPAAYRLQKPPALPPSDSYHDLPDMLPPTTGEDEALTAPSPAVPMPLPNAVHTIPLPRTAGQPFPIARPGPAPAGWPNPIFADEVVPETGSSTTLSEMEAIALGNNPTLTQAAMRVEAARGKCVQAGLYPNPRIGWEADEMGIDGSAGQQGAFIGQEIVTAGKRQARQAVIAQEIRQAEHAWTAQRARVLCDVRRAWYEVLAAQRIVQLDQRLVRINEEAAEAAAKLEADGSVDAVDVWQARVETDSAKLQLAAAKNRFRAGWRRLTAVLGTPCMKPQVLAGNLENDLPELTWSKSLYRVLTESPELAAARAAVCRAQAVIARECAERIPNFDVRVGVRYHDGTDDTVAGLEVGLPLPIYDRNQGNIRKAQAELIESQREVRRVELLLQQRLATVFQRYATAQERVAKYTAEILPGAKRSLDEVLQGYPQMKYDYLTLLTAQRTFYRVNLAYLESLREYRASGALIEGLLLSGGL